jgi:hypothetical protein
VDPKLIMVHASLQFVLCTSTCDAITMLVGENMVKYAQKKIPYK